MKHLLKASKSEEILAVIEGLAVDQNGHFLSTEQATNVNAELERLEAVELASATLVEQLATATSATETATEALATATATIAERDATIAAQAQEIATLKAGPAAGFTQTAKAADDLGKGAENKYETSFDREARLRAEKFGV